MSAGPWAMPETRSASFAKALAWAGVLTVAVGAGAFVAMRGSTAGPGGAAVCSADADVGAALLLDVAKPVPQGTSDRALRDVGARLAAGVELRVYAVGADAADPVGELCRPYANEALLVAAAKDGLTVRDCNDLPAQIPPELRTAAARYCGERAALARLVDGLRPSGDRPVEAADLTAAIEAIVRDLDDGRPSTLFVASDMLQHTARYSHLDLDWTEWGFRDFEAATRPRERMIAPRPEGLEVRVLYVPRRGLTDVHRVRDAHWAFWRRYFAPAEVVFEASPDAPAYEAKMRMDLAAAAVDVARERANAAVLKREADDELQAVGEALDELAITAREAEAAVATLAARVARVRRDREAADTERARLLALWEGHVTAAPAVDPGLATERPLTADDPAAGSFLTPACALRLLAPFAAAAGQERYLDVSANFGAGTVVVEYAVAADGVPIAGSLVVDRGRSSATRAEHLDALADDAVRVVGAWRFEVACGTGQAIGADGWPATATVSYRQKCTGAPIPRCRTVFAEATP